MFADSAYRGNHFRDAVRAKGGIPRIVATGMWGRDEAETLRKLHEWNQPIHRVRGRIEKIFGTWTRCYGLRRMRWRGLAKAAVQVHLTAIAYNLKRTMNILSVPARYASACNDRPDPTPVEYSSDFRVLRPPAHRSPNKSPIG
ncbi:transposase [Sphingobium sp. MI1205]|uniref:transposase n=1 Tax=Sphingobium sp. MI1205 TaxID=407020 RepID=UPI001910EABB